jgi:hypothetical protein
MAYKISGTKSETARIMVLKESDWSIESNTVISGSGAYSVEDLETGNKLAFSRAENGATVGFGGVSPIYYAEPAAPGEDWVPRTPAADNGWRGVCWSPELTLFVAVAESGTDRVMTSPDGITWTIRDSAVEHQHWASVCWSPEQTLFVAVSDDSGGFWIGGVMISPDGIVWQARNTIERDWQSVCWSPEESIFVAVASTGTGDRVMTASSLNPPIGEFWTAGVSAADNDWQSVCWSPDESIFVAVASTGTGDRVMTSSDGIIWTSQTSAADNQWNGVCWSPELTRFAAVSTDGTGDGVMTSG